MQAQSLHSTALYGLNVTSTLNLWTHTHTYTHTLSICLPWAIASTIEIMWQQRCMVGAVFSFYMLSRYGAGTVYFRTWEGSREARTRNHYWEQNESRKRRPRYEWKWKTEREREREREGSRVGDVEITFNPVSPNPLYLTEIRQHSKPFSPSSAVKQKTSLTFTSLPLHSSPVTLSSSHYSLATWFLSLTRRVYALQPLVTVNIHDVWTPTVRFHCSVHK